MRKLSLTLTFIIALTCSSLGLAQLSVSGVAPRLIRYSAALPSTLAETGAVGVTFSIYRDQFDGAPLWSEIQNVQADTKGGYSVLLGSTRNEGLPMELFDTAETRWLEVAVNGAKQPRVQIGSVPYAMVAENAQTLGGLPPSAYLRVTPDSTPGGTVDRVSSPSTVGSPFRPLATSGSGGYLAVFTNSTDLGNSALFQNGNTVTIGGTTSLGAFTLTGNAPGGDTAGMALYNAGGGSGASVSLDMYNTSFNSGIPQAKMKAVDDGNYSDNLTFSLKNPGAATNALVERMRITSVGNVGIGTTNPGSKLEVAGGIKISETGSGITFSDGTTLTRGIAGTTGTLNFGFGPYALSANLTGYGNTAIGISTLESNATGAQNSAIGHLALRLNTSGGSNTAMGYFALERNISGSGNTAMGNNSLSNNFSGSFDIALGSGSGGNITTGSNNIEIGNVGTSSDDHVIRIGDVQTQTFIAGITSVNVSGVPVVVSSTGQLGIASSSRRFKENIHDMGDASERLMHLRPVTYNYKQAYEDGAKPLDYGLIAEEVAEVYPDLVAHSQDGQIQTVMYQKLTPMLLNEVQRLRAKNAAQDEVIRAMERRLERLESKL